MVLQKKKKKKSEKERERGKRGVRDGEGNWEGKERRGGEGKKRTQRLNMMNIHK